MNLYDDDNDDDDEAIFNLRKAFIKTDVQFNLLRIRLHIYIHHFFPFPLLRPRV